MNLKNIFILSLLLRGLFCTAQTTSTDSITVWLSQSEQLSKAENGSEALVLAEKSLQSAEKIGNKAQVSWAARHVGMAYRVLGQYQKAATAYQLSLENQDGRAETTTRLTAEYARILQHQRRNVEAMELYLKALDMYNNQLSATEASRNLDIRALILERMAALLANQKQYDEAERYVLEAYQISQKLNDNIRLEITATTAGNIYYWKKDFKKAEEFYQKAYDFSQLSGRISGRTLNNLAIAYNNSKQYDKAIATYNKAIEVYKKRNEYELIAQTHVNIGSSYNDAGRYVEAIEYVEKGIRELQILKSTAGMPEAYQELVSIYSHKNDLKNALDYQKKLTELKDSIAAKSRQKDLAEFQARFETSKKEGEIQGLKGEKAVRDLIVQRQKLDLENQKLLSERNAAALKVSEREQDVQDLELQKTAAELKESEQIKDLQAAQLILNQKDTQLKQQEIEETQKNVNILRGLLLLGALLVLALWQVFRYRQRADSAKKKLENERLQNETHRSLIEMKAEALRSQMNPHFIFNSLNTIEGFMLQNRTIEASTFLQKFSKLIRLVLENSRHSTISLEQDLEVLRIYVQLESIRYEGTFKYEFDIDDFILEYKMPPTLIQPFVENAILHGLRNRNKLGGQEATDGFLKITVEEIEKNIIVRIEDNGVGRENARKIEKNSTISSKTSIGMDNTAERLRIFSPDAKLIIADVNPNAPDGNVGTRVEFRLPR